MSGTTSSAPKEGIAVLSTKPFDGKKVVDLPTGVFPRKLILVRVFGKVFANAHLDFANAGTRESQAKKMVAEAAMFAGADPIVALGDFNETPSDPVYKVFMDAAYTDAWSTLRMDKGFTFPATAPDRRIDFIFLRAVTPKTITTFLEMKVGGITGSDHLGVWAGL